MWQNTYKYYIKIDNLGHVKTFQCLYRVYPKIQWHIYVVFRVCLPSFTMFEQIHDMQKTERNHFSGYNPNTMQQFKSLLSCDNWKAKEKTLLKLNGRLIFLDE